MIFDINMGGKLTRKERLVADGNITDAPALITKLSVVSRDSVRIGLTIASLNGLEVFACDISNQYLNGTCRNKLWNLAGAEFGSDKGNFMIKYRALYGLKSSGAAWRSNIVETLQDIGYFPSEYDPDVWLKKDMKPDGSHCWNYMLVYVDHVLHIAHDPKKDMDQLKSIYRFKNGAEPLDRYLCDNVREVQLQDGSVAWSMTCVNYLKGAIEKFVNTLQESGTALKNFGYGRRPYPSLYIHELDVTLELDDKMTNCCQQ